MADKQGKGTGGGDATATSGKQKRAQPASRRDRPKAEAAIASPAAPDEVRIGVISDTHGYLDPEVLKIFAGVTHIIHAGDVMDPAILSALETVAPVTAVAGNLDAGELAKLPREVAGTIGGVRFVVGHKPRRLLKRLAAGKYAGGGDPGLVVWGHLHTPTVAWVDGALHLNPGTASSPDDEDDGPTVAIVQVWPHGLGVFFVPLQRRPPQEPA
jgi:putative phosphoesterase